MHSFFTRTVISLLGITFGFFIGCSTLKGPSKDSVEPDDLTKEQIEAKLQSLNKNIDTGNTNADLLYQKGFLLSELAKKTENPGERTETYGLMQRTLKNADEAFASANLPSGNQKVDELLKITWSNEHNQGVQIMQSDSTLSGEDLDTAAIHFKNATSILPDTAISYKMQARAYYQNHKIDQAIATLEKANNQIDTLPAEMMEQLAFLYLEDEQPQKAIEVFEKAESFSERNLNVLHGLANAYISAGEHAKAVSLLEKLTENQPGNIIYLQALATEYYYLAETELNTLFSGSLSEQSKRQAMAEADSLFEEARTHYENALSESNGNQDMTKTVAQFYQNAAAKYQKLLPNLEEDRKAGILQKINDYLRASLPLYHKMVERNPGSTQLWENLYEVYSYLGMTQQAEEAKANIN